MSGEGAEILLPFRKEQICFHKKEQKIRPLGVGLNIFCEGLSLENVRLRYFCLIIVFIFFKCFVLFYEIVSHYERKSYPHRKRQNDFFNIGRAGPSSPGLWGYCGH